MTGRNLLWPLVIIGVGLAALLLAADILDPNIGDLMQRAWPILLILFGLNTILAGRVRFGSFIAVGLSVGVLAGVIVYAYSVRADTLRDDYIEELGPIVLTENVTAVEVRVETVSSRVVFEPNTEWGGNTIGARFVGSRESDLSIEAVQDDQTGVVTFTITETRPNTVPNLEDIGTGELEVFLPIGVPVRPLVFTNQRGATTLDFRFLPVERFDVTSRSGDVNLYMPFEGVVIGDVTLENGDLLVVVGSELSVNIQGANPERTEIANPNDYLQLTGGEIRSQPVQESFQMTLRVDLDGVLSLASPEDLARQEAEGGN